jgi:Putative adhesin
MTSWTITEPDRLDLDGEVERLDVSLIAGRLNVVGTDGPARVEVTRVNDASPVIVSVEDGRLSVRHPTPKSWNGLLQPLWWFLKGGRNMRSDVSVALPYGAAATLTLTSGSAVASAIHGDLSVNVVSGRITMLGNAGRQRAKVVSGPIEALGCYGDLNLETVSGEITIAESSTEKVYAKTVSGALTADLDNTPKHSEIRLETVSGEITIRVREDSDLAVSLNATGGRVTSAFPQLAGGRGENWAGKRLAGVLGAGTGKLYASAMSGAIWLLARPVDDDGFDGENTPEAPEGNGDQR